MTEHSDSALHQLPDPWRDLAAAAVAAARNDARVVGVLVGGSVASGTADGYSDLDLVLACTDRGATQMLAEAQAFARQLGPVLVAFTGEHVGEPRLLIVLYGPPLRHVDLKFIGLSDLGARVEDGLVLWQRDDMLGRALRRTGPVWPSTDPQWVEDRFWVWVHYVTAKIGRGEVLEAVEALTMMRSLALAPLASMGRTDKPAGVRRIETLAPEHAAALRATVAGASREDCVRALRATIALYQQLRDSDPHRPSVQRHEAAELAVTDYLRRVT